MEAVGAGAIRDAAGLVEPVDPSGTPVLPSTAPTHDKVAGCLPGAAC
jgi:hypothetical protein